MQRGLVALALVKVFQLILNLLYLNIIYFLKETKEEKTPVHFLRALNQPGVAVSQTSPASPQTANSALQELLQRCLSLSNELDPAHIEHVTGFAF